MGLISSVDSRLVLMNARRTLTKLAKRYKRKINWQTTRLSQSYLRSEVTLDLNATTYNFPILVNENGGAAGKKEVRLNLQDTFFVSHVGYFIVIAVSDYVKGTTFLENTLWTFPSTAWNSKGVADFQLPQLRMLWQSQLKLTVDNRVICIAWDTDRNYVAPIYQRPQFTLEPNDGYVFTDARDGAADGFYPCEPNWLLSGSKNNQLQLTLPQSLTGLIPGPAVTSGVVTVMKAVCVMRGVLAQNSTSIF